MCSRFTVRRSRRYLKHEFRLGDSSAMNTQGYTYMHIVYYLYKYINNYIYINIYMNIFNERLSVGATVRERERARGGREGRRVCVIERESERAREREGYSE